MNFTSVCNNSGSPGQSKVWLITLFSTYPSSSRCCVRKNKEIKKAWFPGGKNLVPKKTASCKHCQNWLQRDHLLSCNTFES